MYLQVLGGAAGRAEGRGADIARIARLRTAIGDPTRLQLLFPIGERGRLSVGEFA